MPTKFMKKPETYKIVINRQEQEVYSERVSYSKILRLAGFDPARVMSVTFSKANAIKPYGILGVGESVRIQNGTIFNVVDTSLA